MPFDPRAPLDTFGYGVDSLSICVYGDTKVGKTSLALTTPEAKTIIFGTEPGLLPLRDRHIRYYQIDTAQDLDRAVSWLESGGPKLRGYWIFLDSLSDIAERLLVDLKAQPKKDPRQAYGEVADICLDALKRLRALPCHTVVICKLDRLEDLEGATMFGPSLPGAKLSQKVGYEFELVLAYRTRGTGERVERWLQTEPDGRYQCGDRSGVLEPREAPDLGAIAEKILASVQRPPTDEQTQSAETDA